jgi:ABC-type transport system involved in cytochrome c biogenesis permease subunit
MILALAVHSFGLVARMYIQDRPFVWVTNLYSSAIFIGWGCALFCLFIEFIFPKSIALVAGSAVAAITSGVIAHHLSLSGDTMEMMQAVLDTNFWLATHVTCITLGYTATFLAGFLGILYILLGLFTPLLQKDGSTILSKMIYGVVCFATLLSFTGTVLGGIWADQSWGRFWGWDPKENGALMIVLWNALVLHARWGGLVKDRGLAALAVAGSIVTSWSWFGVNELGIGLHSYGFTEGVLRTLALFVATQLGVIALALLPKHLWRSFRTQRAA